MYTKYKQIHTYIHTYIQTYIHACTTRGNSLWMTSWHTFGNINRFVMKPIKCRRDRYWGVPNMSRLWGANPEAHKCLTRMYLHVIQMHYLEVISKSNCTCIHTYVSTPIKTYTYKHKYTYVCTQYVHVYIRTYIRTYIRMYVCMYVCNTRTYAHIHTIKLKYSIKNTPEI